LLLGYAKCDPDHAELSGFTGVLDDSQVFRHGKDDIFLGASHFE